MRPEHIDLLHSVGRPSPTPDGTHAVVAVTHPDLDEDRYTSELWVVAIEDGASHRLTVGPLARLGPCSEPGRESGRGAPRR